MRYSRKPKGRWQGRRREARGMELENIFVELVEIKKELQAIRGNLEHNFIKMNVSKNEVDVDVIARRLEETLQELVSKNPY